MAECYREAPSMLLEAEACDSKQGPRPRRERAVRQTRWNIGVGQPLEQGRSAARRRQEQSTLCGRRLGGLCRSKP